MNIIVDANVIVAALIQRGIVRQLVLAHPGAFLTPDACVDEVWDNREDWNRRRVPEALVREALDLLTEHFIAVLPRLAYREREEEARTLIRDPDDVPVVALALAVDNRGVWTFNTRDFSGSALLARIFASSGRRGSSPSCRAHDAGSHRLSSGLSDAPGQRACRPDGGTSSTGRGSRPAASAGGTAGFLRPCSRTPRGRTSRTRTGTRQRASGPQDPCQDARTAGPPRKALDIYPSRSREDTVSPGVRFHRSRPRSRAGR